ncbi:MAG TPA: dTMP kinase [Thermoplasmata archaeon]|nr:dTMP kinase [Thermoplasmata archaeon]
MRRRSAPRGALIVLEGIDGAGKSAVAHRLAARWRSAGIRVVGRREPADAALGRAAVLLAGRDPWASAMIFSLDRSLVRARVDAEIARGRIVLQDRSYYSTLAYQADRLSEGDRRRIERLQHRVASSPDRVVWLDLAPEVALRRVRERGRRREPTERRAFLRRVRSAYARLCRAPRWIRVDASRPIEEVVDEVDRRLARFLASRDRRAPRRR